MTLIETDGRFVTHHRERQDHRGDPSRGAPAFSSVVNASARRWGAPGRPFESLIDAVDYYKNADVKQALRALISDLV